MSLTMILVRSILGFCAALAVVVMVKQLLVVHTSTNNKVASMDVHALLEQLQVKSDAPAAQDSGDNGQKSSSSVLHKPLNIVLLYPDDWRHDDLGDVQPLLKTPFFSWMAQQGIRFTHNAVTTSICWISRASLFTGQYVSQHASTYLFRPHFAEHNWQHTWPYLLQQKAGYWVGHVGKWQYHDKNGYRDKIFNYSYYFEGVMWMGKDHIATKARDVALAFLRQRPKEKPFAMTVAFYPPKGVSDPADVDPRFLKQYENLTIPEIYDRDAAYEALPLFLKDNSTLGRARYLPRFEERDYQTTMRSYYASLTHIDEMCRDIVEELKQQGVLDNTMIIVTPDNGEFHSAHALADKWYPYQESIRVPLIIKDPRMPQHKRGTLDDSMTLNIDLAETILGAAGVAPDSKMQGRDIAELYLSEHPANQNASKEPWRKEFYYIFPFINYRIPPSQALVRKDYKYIQWPNHDNYEQLFDLQTDPYEFDDLLRYLNTTTNHTGTATNQNHADLAKIRAIRDEMKAQMIEQQHAVMHPYVPGTTCDTIWPAGKTAEQKKAPNCSQVLPDRCCPGTQPPALSSQ